MHNNKLQHPLSYLIFILVHIL